MAKWPSTTNAYPAIPKAYPATPKAYPVTLAQYPAGALVGRQSFDVEIVATRVAGVPAQLRVQVAQAVITLGTTMRATGTTPPVVLLAAGTGSLTFGAGLCPGFHVDILAGAATFDLSFDSGATVTFAAQTIPVGGGNYTIPSGTYAGMIITFPNGTYNADNLYQGVVTTIRSTEGSSYTFSQATAANQPILIKAAAWSGAQDALFGTGGAIGLHSTDAAVVALLTDDPAVTTMGRVHYSAQDATGYWITAGDSGQATDRTRRYGQNSTGLGRLRLITQNNAAGAAIRTSSPDPTAPNALHNECWRNAGSAGAVTLRVDGVSTALDLGTINIGSPLTPTRVGLMTEGDSAPANGIAGYVVDVALFNSSLSDSDAAIWEGKLTAGTS